MPDEKTPEEIARERGDYIDENNPPGELEGDADEDANVELEDDTDPDAEEGEDEDAELDEELLEDEEPGFEASGADEEEEESPPPITIPKARFDEAQRKARDRQRELERRIEDMEKSQTQAEAKKDLGVLDQELEELTVKYEDLLMEGELEAARKVRQEKDRKQNAIIDMRLKQQGEQASSVAVEQMRFDAQLAQFEAKYPAINPDSDAFNQDLVEEVNEMLTVYKNSGYTLAASLNKAVHYVIREDEPRVGDDPDIVRRKRGQTARKKVNKAVKASPPNLQDTGRDSDKRGSGDGLPDVTKMSEKQFADLSEADLRKLRGDTLSDEEAA